MPPKPDPAQIAAQASDATKAAFFKAHLGWSLGGDGTTSTVTPTCQALTDTLAKCDVAASYVAANGAIDISRTAKSTVNFYPYGVDAVLSDETCTDRVALRVGIRSLCGSF